MIRVVFCWSNISGYMAACWRNLIESTDCAVHVVAWSDKRQTEFAHGVMKGIPCTLLNEKEREDAKYIRSIVNKQRPDVLVLSGWMSRAYMRLTEDHSLRDTKFVMAMDNPWWGRWRQYGARFRLWNYLRRFHMVVVTGERAWQYALRLGFPPEKIKRGLYGVDVTGLAPMFKERKSGAWPRRFLFIGRYAKVKGLDILVDAYRDYRKLVDDPWRLTCCGKGPLDHLIRGEAGIENRGFVQPDDLAGIWRDSGAFVLPSRFDAWPLVVVEACAAGLPVLASEVCGSTVELVRSHYNGWLLPAGNVSLLTSALVSAHKAYHYLPEMGAHSQAMAGAYSAEIWANRWREWLSELSAAA